VRRPAIAVWLPSDELGPVSLALDEAGFESIAIRHPADLEGVLAARPDVAVAIIDGENDFDGSILAYELLHDRRDVATLMVVSERTLDRVIGSAAALSASDEYVTRPYSAESLRWRAEAMIIRAQTVDDGTGDVIQTGSLDATDWTHRGTVLVVFNPKGGVGKTTVATNLAATLASRSQRVLLIDADTVTGHVSSSLGLEQVRSVADSWHEEAQDGVAESFVEIASPHPSGVKVVSLTSSPLHTEVLEPSRVGNAIAAARRSFDVVVIDTHPSYGPLNLAIFDQADRILLPVTPDLPAIRAAVQLRDVAVELGIQERLALVVNRANSGLSVADMERTVGLPALALIRSGGLLFVRAANEGRTVIERYPREKVTEDFATLADRIVPGRRAAAEQPKPALRSLFGRKEVARA
jgi:MinD-like ATPase involved in chromosome partitioning or flagellar assembly